MSRMASERGKGRWPCYQQLIRQEGRACPRHNTCRGSQMCYSNVQGRESHAGLMRHKKVCPLRGAGCLEPKEGVGFSFWKSTDAVASLNSGECGGEEALEIELNTLQVSVGCSAKARATEGKPGEGHQLVGDKPASNEAEDSR